MSETRTPMTSELIREFAQAVASCPRCQSCADMAADLLRHHDFASQGPRPEGGAERSPHDDRLLAIASLVNGYHNGDQSDAPGVLRAIADALGPPFERSPKPPPSVTVEQATAEQLVARSLLTPEAWQWMQGRAEAEATIAQRAQEVERLQAFVREFAERALKAESALASLTAERDRLREALVKVRAHTSYLAPANADLLRGLLASVERIAEAALQAQRGTP